ncbi:hypothetical protein ACFWAN_49235 [Streptomyces mirabilis]|uniref:hypothetical protein n=1 Tax=Streptomyces mirabilis TaxID=68239 RepID=UPI00364ED28F
MERHRSGTGAASERCRGGVAAITYVASPVDAKYQSLNVSVPVKIDGKAVDATNAPIVFANAVGGYMPSSVADATGVGGAEMTGGMPTGGAGGGASPSASAGPSASSSAARARCSPAATRW